MVTNVISIMFQCVTISKLVLARKATIVFITILVKLQPPLRCRPQKKEQQRGNREKDEYIHVEYLYPAMHTYQRQQCVLVPKLLLLGSLLLLLLCCPLLLLLEQELFSLLCFPLLHTIVGIDPNHFRPVAKQQRIQLGHRTTTK